MAALTLLPTGDIHNVPHPSHSIQHDRQYNLEDLVADIRSYLGGSSGVGDDEIDPQHLISLMQRYEASCQDWLPFVNNIPGKSYTKNLISSINGRANLLLVVWNPGRSSPIHDHADAHCIMKMLSGQLRETVYYGPEPSETGNTPLQMKSDTIYQKEEVTYISDDIGVHRVSNVSETELAMSLHLYTPPNAAHFGYNIFDKSTGRKSHVS